MRSWLFRLSSWTLQSKEGTNEHTCTSMLEETLLLHLSKVDFIKARYLRCSDAPCSNSHLIHYCTQSFGRENNNVDHVQFSHEITLYNFLSERSEATTKTLQLFSMICILLFMPYLARDDTGRYTQLLEKRDF